MLGNINTLIFLIFLVILQLLEAAWCLTNIAAGKQEETKALLPALPLLIAHLGGTFVLLLYNFIFVFVKE